MTTKINGVDRDAIFATIDAINEQPALAEFEFRIENEWVDGGHNRTVVRDFYGTCQDIAHAEPFVLHNDEPPVLLSGDKGPNPVENLLHALAGCVTTAMVYHASAHGIAIEGVRSRFEGDINLQGFLGIRDDVRNGYQEIRVTFEIDGEMSLEEKRELVEMGSRFSPVFDVVSNGTSVKCQIAEDVMAQAAE